MSDEAAHSNELPLSNELMKCDSSVVVAAAREKDIITLYST